MSTVLYVPPVFRRGQKKGNQAEHLASAQKLLRRMCDILEVDDLSTSDVLDMGCGTKLVQALLDNDMPIQRYVGVDIYKEMIDFLSSEVTDERFSFHHMNSHNQMYNPDGVALEATQGLPFPDYQFDIITLFSVFTHLAPHDYSEMLKLLRPYVKPEGKIFFSLFVYEPTAGGHGLIDGINRSVREKGGVTIESEESSSQDIPDFVDLNTERPLTWAVYSREHATNLVKGTGWIIESLNDPEEFIQHYMICVPS